MHAVEAADRESHGRGGLARMADDSHLRGGA
jgi:hypothetical protein